MCLKEANKRSVFIDFSAKMIEDVDPQRDLLFRHPFTAIVAGSSSSGKTTLVTRIVNHLPHLTTPEITKPIRVLWCTGSFARPPPIPNKDVAVTVRTGAPPEDPECDVIVVDDQMTDMADSKSMSDLFTKHSHHRNISIIFILQNLFVQGKHMRNITLNAHYIFLTKSRRDLNQVKRLGQQVFGNSTFFFNAYKKCVLERDYGYILLDLSPNTDERFRVRSNIIPTEYPIEVFVPA